MNRATKLGTIVAIALAAGLPALATAAPSVYDGDVIIKIGSTVKKATGSIANATGRQSIGCELAQAGNSDFIECVASDLSGQTVNCRLIWRLDRFGPIVASISPSSHVSFTMNSSNTCTSLTVINGSRYLK